LIKTSKTSKNSYNTEEAQSRTHLDNPRPQESLEKLITLENL